jgi:hypothetical protein
VSNVNVNQGFGGVHPPQDIKEVFGGSFQPCVNTGVGYSGNIQPQTNLQPSVNLQQDFNQGNSNQMYNPYPQNFSEPNVNVNYNQPFTGGVSGQYYGGVPQNLGGDISGYSNIQTSTNIPQTSQGFSSSNINLSSNNWRAAIEYFKNPLFFQNESTNIFYFDFNTEQWISVKNTNNQYIPKFVRSTELPDGSFFLTGGEWQGEATDTALHFINFNFIAKNQMLNRRKAHSAIYVKGHIYVFGGFGENGVLNSCEKYDMNQGYWSQLPYMKYSRAYTTLVRHGDNQIFLVGGFNPQKIDGVYLLFNINIFSSLSL